ncbi:MAG: STAS domain-containing protein [Aeromonas sp.]
MSQPVYALSGALTRDQVRGLWQARNIWWPNDSLDLSAVNRLDSAGLALLVQWAKAALSRGAKPCLINASADFHTLATLYGVAALFTAPSPTPKD